MVPEVAGSIPVVHPLDRVAKGFLDAVRRLKARPEESSLRGVDPPLGAVYSLRLRSEPVLS